MRIKNIKIEAANQTLFDFIGLIGVQNSPFTVLFSFFVLDA
ncbi:MAG: hypothetical protein ACRCST_06030 [Turicibacter sp.]